LGTLLSVLVTIVVGLGGLLLILLGLYWLTNFLPRSWRERGRIAVFIGPTLFLLLIGLFIPALRTIYTSLLADPPKSKFVGLKNYRDIFAATDTRLTVFNSLTWVVVGTAAVVLVGLVVARFADGMRGENTAKSLIFIPGAVSLAGAGIIWGFVYAGPPFKVGLLNQVAKGLHLPDSLGGTGDRLWLLERGIGGITPPAAAPGFNTFLLIVIFMWASAGFATVVFSAAIKGVPDTLIEAAKVDGATNRQTFYKVTLPYIRATVITVATTTIIGGLKAFDIVAATTGGNFGTSNIAYSFYFAFFRQDRDGLGSAFAVLLFSLVIPVVVVNRRAQKRAAEIAG